jgi:hypothetical protein
MTDIVTKIMAEVLNTLALATKQVSREDQLSRSPLMLYFATQRREIC